MFPEISHETHEFHLEIFLPNITWTLAPFCRIYQFLYWRPYCWFSSWRIYQIGFYPFSTMAKQKLWSPFFVSMDLCTFYFFLYAIHLYFLYMSVKMKIMLILLYIKYCFYSNSFEELPTNASHAISIASTSSDPK